MLKLTPARGEADVRARWALAEAISTATQDTEEQSLLVAVALRESSFRPAVLGDFHSGKATSFCAFQLHLPGGARTAEGWTGEDVSNDVGKCTTAALRRLRESRRACGGYPKEDRLAIYARGRCDSEEGRKLSRDRMGLAKRVEHLLVTTKPTPEATVGEALPPVAVAR